MRVVAALFVLVACLSAQDPFEIHVYEYEPLPLGEFTYEAHTNYVVDGPITSEGRVAPLNHRFHFTSEFTAGVTEWFRAAAVVLTAKRPDHGLEYAGFRVLPHFYAPASWRLPLNLGLVAEFSFQPEVYAENSRTVELRAIVEKHLGRLELDGNPVFAHALRGPDVSRGWSFEPSARLAWRASKLITPSLEYYSALGSIRDLPSVRNQIHQVVPGADIRLGDRVTWNLGAGLGLTPRGGAVIIKSRVEIGFGKAHRHN